MKYYLTSKEILESKLPQEELRQLIEDTTRRRIELTDNYGDHDCHASPADGCQVCEEMRIYEAERNLLLRRGFQLDPEQARFSD